MTDGFHSPKDLHEAVQLLEHLPVEGTVALAGGTDLMLKIKRRAITPRHVINLARVQEMRGVARDSRGFRIGATTTFDQLLGDERIRTYYPVLYEACSQVGSKQIRNRATLGGNVCNASPAADAALALVALKAEFVLTSPGGTQRVVPSELFFEGPGKTTLRPREILTDIILRLPDRPLHCRFEKMKRTAVDVATVSVAVVLKKDPQGRILEGSTIALGAAAPTPRRATGAESMLVGNKLTPGLIDAVAEAVVAESSPISDHRASREYRMEMVRVLTKSALLDLA